METKIIQQIQKLFTAVDERDWEKVESTMNDTVLLDYSSMNGDSAEFLTPKNISNAWASFLPGFDRTHHQLSDFTVRINGKTATAHYKGVANHFLNGEAWIVDGTYDTKLKSVNGTWLIYEHKLNFTEQSGNSNLPSLATEKMKDKK